MKTPPLQLSSTRLPPDDFHALMAEQLRHAPWLALSALVHALVVLVLLLIPAERQREDEIATRFMPTEQPVPPEPDPPPPPKPDIERPQEPDLQVNDPVPTDVVDDPVTDDFRDLPIASTDDPLPDSSRLGIGGGMRGRYGNRPGRNGDRIGRIGDANSEHIRRGLEWLAAHQDADGKWDADGFMKHDSDGEACDGAGNAVHDVGATGLALLAFLGNGSTMRSGEYRDQIKRGVQWLLKQQRDSGLFGSNASHDYIYDHAIAAYAMVEAFGLSDSTMLRKYAQGGINYLESHRNPYAVWRYQPRDNDNDASVTGWCVMAYESGKYFGLKVSDTALKTCAAWFDSVTTPDGRCGYTKPNEPSSRHPGDHGTRFPVERGDALTAVGLFCRFFMGQDPDEVEVMTAAANRLLQRPPVWDEAAGTIDHYYWYYATYALYQMGGRHWKEWSRKLTPALLETQRKDGNFRGSWDPAGAWGDDGGRVYSTAILTLTLQAYFRYTRLVR